MTTNNMTFSATQNFQVGSILVQTWGCEQTNVDFFGVIARKGDFVTIVKLKKETLHEGALTMTSKNTPTQEVNGSVKPQRKKVKCFNGEESGFSLEFGGGWVRPWKGTPQTASHYA